MFKRVILYGSTAVLLLALTMPVGLALPALLFAPALSLYAPVFPSDRVCPFEPTAWSEAWEDWKKRNGCR